MEIPESHDPDVGLYFYGARYYDPFIGRFLSPDSIVQTPGDPQTLNRYSYCRNNPLLYTDPSGHFFIETFIGAVIGAVLGATTSAISGGDVGLGALTGAITGAFMGGVGFGVSDLGLKGVPAAVAYTAAGTSAGALNASISGADVGIGALSGGAFAAARAGIGIPNQLWKVGAYAAVGGGLSELQGGDFWQGALMGGSVALMAYEFNVRTDIGEGAREATGQLSDGSYIRKPAGVSDYQFLKIKQNYQNYNWMGKFVRTNASNLGFFWNPTEDGYLLRLISSHIPCFNDISYYHDFLMVGLGDSDNIITNFGSMIPAAAITVSAEATYYGIIPHY